MKRSKIRYICLISFIIGLILASGITVYAYSSLARDIKYTDDKSVESALNELYDWQTNSTYLIEGFATVQNNGGNGSTMTIEVKKDLQKAMLIYSAGNGDSGNDAYSLFRPTEVTISSTESNVTLLQSKTNRTYGNTYSGSSAQELYYLENLSIGDIITIVGYHKWGGFAFATLVSYGATE